jgi:HlyD family secretion protein
MHVVVRGFVATAPRFVTTKPVDGSGGETVEMTDEARRTRAKKRRWLLLSTALLLSASLGVWLLLRPAPVAVATAETRDVVETLLTTGRVEYRGTRDVAPEFGGRVEQVHVREGDSVVTGDILVLMDTEDAQLQLRSHEAALADAQARLQRLRGTVRPVALTSLDQARLDRERAARELERVEELEEQGIGTQQQVDTARDALRAATIAETRAEAELRSLGSRGVDVLSAIAQVDAAGVAVERVELQIARASLRSPLDGIVLERGAEPGEVVPVGRAILTIAPRDGVEVRLQPDERELARIEAGQRVWISAAGLEDTPLEGVIDRVLPVVDAQRGVMDARVALSNPAPELRPNMTVDAEVELRQLGAQTVIPAAAVRYGQDEVWVLVFENGRVSRRTVSLGWRGAEVVAVSAGVSEGDDVVVGTPDLAPGRRARVTERVDVGPSADAP